jgi:chromosome segregation ATPase
MEKLFDELKTLIGENPDAAEVLREIEDKALNVLDDLDAANDEIGSLESEISDLQHEVDDLQYEVDDLRDNLSQIESLCR